MSTKDTQKSEITTIRNVIRYITTELTEIYRIIMEYYEKLYRNRLDSLDKMEKIS